MSPQPAPATVLRSAGTAGTAAGITVIGAGAGAGKTLMCVALLRYLTDQGCTAVPFKAVSFVNHDDKTSRDPRGFARPLHHHLVAAGLPWAIDYNPVAIVPDGHRSGTLVLEGEPYGEVELAGDDQLDDDLLTAPLWEKCARAIRNALDRCRDAADIVVIEGAGDGGRPSARCSLANDVPAVHTSFPVAAVIRDDRSRYGSATAFLSSLRPGVRSQVRFIVNNMAQNRADPPAPPENIVPLTIAPLELSRPDGTLRRQRARLRELKDQVLTGHGWAELIAAVLPTPHQSR